MSPTHVRPPLGSSAPDALGGEWLRPRRYPGPPTHSGTLSRSFGQDARAGWGPRPRPDAPWSQGRQHILRVFQAPRRRRAALLCPDSGSGVLPKTSANTPTLAPTVFSHIHPG